MLSLFFLLFVILVISRFGFKRGIWVLIPSVPGHCILITFKPSKEERKYEICIWLLCFGLSVIPSVWKLISRYQILVQCNGRNGFGILEKTSYFIKLPYSPYK